MDVLIIEIAFSWTSNVSASLDSLGWINPKLKPTIIWNIFFLHYSDLDRNNITRITKTDFAGLKNLRVL